MKNRKTLVASAMLLVLSACSNSDDDEKISLDQELRDLIATQNITANPEQGIDAPSIDTPLAQLGMNLFFSKALGGKMDSACVTCHHPQLGGGDRLALSIGVEAVDPDLLGPGRLHSANGTHHDGGPTVPRNAPTTFNIALYTDSIFHDGRVEVLADNSVRTPDVAFGETDPKAIDLVQAQALFPVTSAEEMRGDFLQGESNAVLRQGLMARIVNQEIGNDWYQAFQTAFDSTEPAETLITMNNIAIAIGEYEKSQLFVQNPWRNYVDGDDSAISDSAKRGALLFYRSVEQGGANCVSCHSSAKFSDESFHVVAMPQIGRGKGNGDNGDDDFGRFRETGQANDKYAFRTPILLNVEATLPYGHAGAYATLKEVVKHHLDPAQAIAEFDFTGSILQQGMQLENAEANTALALAQLQSLQAAGQSKLQTVSLNDDQVNDLVSFLKSLTDPCVLDDTCMSQWVPNESHSDHDGMRLVPSVAISAKLD